MTGGFSCNYLLSGCFISDVAAAFRQASWLPPPNIAEHYLQHGDRSSLQRQLAAKGYHFSLNAKHWRKIDSHYGLETLPADYLRGNSAGKVGIFAYSGTLGIECGYPDDIRMLLNR